MKCILVIIHLKNLYYPLSDLNNQSIFFLMYINENQVFLNFVWVMLF